jgi:aryl-phospho-beta-D-glucosidase BglC (GH1 family)
MASARFFSVCFTCQLCSRALNKAYPDIADALFKKHWETWFTQSDVDRLKTLGINAVRIPVGFWIIEALVDRQTEFYAKGGLLQLVSAGNRK